MTTTANKIQDFGAKIGGARKDLYAEAREFAETCAAAANVETLKKCSSMSALVKLPRLAALVKEGAVSAEAARAVLVLYRTIKRKPSTSAWRISYWAQETAPILRNIAALLQGAEVSAEMKENAEYKVLTAANWPLSDFSFSVYSCDSVSAHSFAATYEKVGTTRIFKGSRLVGRVTCAAEAAKMIAEFIEKDSAARADGPKLEASRNRAGVWYIHPAGKKEISIRTLEGVKDIDEVRRIMREDRAALVAEYRALLSVPELRRDWNRPRVGTDWRKGQDATPDYFAQVLPFRGVEFGNWVTQAERASLLNSAFDGFHDLAQLFGLRAVDMTFNGALAFAFASRGKSRAMAHYEPTRRVINLTKKNGAGCMAHEWFHALDNWAEYSEERSGFATETYRGEAAAEIAGAKIISKIRDTEFFRRSNNLALYKGAYWVEAKELAARAFEGVCAFLLRVNGVCSDFLVNCLSMDEFTQKDAAHRSNFYPYPTEAEAATLAPYYFDFFRALFGERVQMSEKVRHEVERLTATAEQEHQAAQAERDEENAAEEAARAAYMAAAKSHDEMLAAANRAKVEVKAEQIKEETGADWFHVFRSVNKYYAVGLGCGFMFLVYYTGNVAYRLLKVNNRIKKAFRGAHCFYLEHREGVDLREVFKHDIRNGFTGSSLLYDVFSDSRCMPWEDFSSKFAKELTAAKEAESKREEVSEAAAEPQTAASEPQKDETAATGKQTAKAAKKGEGVDMAAAPADGLELVEIAGGVAVVGDQRTTYKNRKQIKAHGAKWNHDAKQWQATTAEAVAALREWFGMTEPGAEKTEQQDAAEQTAQNSAQSEENTEAAADTEDVAAEPQSAEDTAADAAACEQVEAVGALASALSFVANAVISAASEAKAAADQAAASAKAAAAQREQNRKEAAAILREQIAKVSEQVANLSGTLAQMLDRLNALESGQDVNEEATAEPQTGTTAKNGAATAQPDEETAQSRPKGGGGSGVSLSMLRAAAEDAQRLTMAGEYKRAALAELYALCACSVDVLDLIDRLKAMSEDSEPAEVKTKCAEVRKFAANRAEVTLSPEVLQALYSRSSTEPGNNKAA